MCEDVAKFKKEAEKIDPPAQPPLDTGNTTEPKHTKATPLKPMGT